MKNTIYTFLIFCFCTSLSFAQEQQTVYYYVTGSGYVEGEGLRAIVTNVRSASCDSNMSSWAVRTAIEKQFTDHLKAEYEKYYDYTSQAMVFDSRGKAENERREYIGNRKTSDYRVTKDPNFAFYCED